MTLSKKSLGQHFLTDKNILGKVAAAAEVSAKDTVLEIGPGTGTLTAVLAERAKKIVAVEKDPELCALLKEKFSGRKNVKVICADILKFNPSSIPYLRSYLSYKIAANIPYYITGRLLRLMFESWPRPAAAVLMLQKEVAERITAKPPKMNRLAAIVQYFTRPEMVAIVRRGAFRPAPRVDSAILALKNIRRPQADDYLTIELMAKGFSHPRKHLAANLAGHFSKTAVLQAFETLNLSPKTRPAELDTRQWIALSTLLFGNAKAYNK